MLTPWNMLVKKIFDKNRSKNAAYRLGDAMRDAKKVYRKTAKTIGSVVEFGKEKRRGRRRRNTRRRRGRRGGNQDDNDDNHNNDDNHDNHDGGSSAQDGNSSASSSSWSLF
jgi:hypothetical protein